MDRGWHVLLGNVDGIQGELAAVALVPDPEVGRAGVGGEMESVNPYHVERVPAPAVGV